MNALRDSLTTVEPGELPNVANFERLLAECWDEFEGSTDGRMQAYKLLGRMEQPRWEPPILSFIVERHGGTVMGSTRAELQHWEVDVTERTARLAKVGRRQLEPMAGRVSIKTMAEEIVQHINDGKDDDRIKRIDDESVKVLVSQIFPTGSGFQRTVSERRKRLKEYIARELSQQGWVETKSNVFKPAAQ